MSQKIEDVKARRYLLSFRYRVVSRGRDGVICEAEPQDAFEVIEEHPLAYLVTSKDSLAELRRRPGDGYTWRSDDILRVYSWVEVPDDFDDTRLDVFR